MSYPAHIEARAWLQVNAPGHYSPEMSDAEVETAIVAWFEETIPLIGRLTQEIGAAIVASHSDARKTVVKARRELGLPLHSN